MDPLVVFQPFEASDPAEPLPPVFRDYVLHSAPELLHFRCAHNGRYLPSKLH